MDQVDGSGKLYANNGQYLGLIPSNCFQGEAITNPYGTYGSTYSSTSIRNPYGEYGSPCGTLGAYNPYTTAPPKIRRPSGLDSDAYWACVSTNQYLFGLTVIDPDDLITYLKTKGGCGG